MLQLEPTNLLEPLDLREDFSPFAKPYDLDRAAKVAQRAPQRPRLYQTATPSRAGGRRALKAALVVVGALACVGVGMALPQLPSLVVSDNNRAPAIEPARPVITADTLPKPAVEPPETKPIETKPPDVKPDEPATTGSSQGAAPDTAPAVQPAQPAPAANDAVAGARPCNSKARNTDANCLAGGPVVPLTEPPPAPANTANAQPVNTEEPAPTAAPQDRKQDRNRSSSRRRDRGNWDESRSASNYWGARDEEVDRGYGARRDRDGDDGRDVGRRTDRRSARRGWNEEERVVERGPRIGGPPGLFGLLPFLGGY
jgi:hypothetical protein